MERGDLEFSGSICIDETTLLAYFFLSRSCILEYGGGGSYHRQTFSEIISFCFVLYSKLQAWLGVLRIHLYYRSRFIDLSHPVFLLEYVWVSVQCRETRVSPWLCAPGHAILSNHPLAARRPRAIRGQGVTSTWSGKRGFSARDLIELWTWFFSVEFQS